jgi:hypothetical protein
MWYPRGKFTGIALMVSIFLFTVGETLYGIIAGVLALILRLAFGGKWQGFVTTVIIILAVLELFTIFNR